MINLTALQYEQLLSYAKLNAATLADVLLLRDSIDAANSITRYVLVVRWQEVPAGYAPNPRPDTYPALQSQTIELTRPPTRDDVIAIITGKQLTTDLVYVTPDPQGIVGWCLLDDYDF